MVSIVMNYDECGMLNGPYYGHYFDVNPFDASVPHPASLCEGNCSKHPLITKSLLPFTHEKMLVSWGDSVFYETLEEEATLTHFQKMERAAAALVEEAARALLVESRVQERYAEKMADIAHIGLKRNEKPKIVKKPFACQWLYVDESVPEQQWRKNEKGVPCAPQRNHLTGAQCWAWERYDKATKTLKCPHTCPYIHPNEEGWHKEWDNNRNWKPPATGFEALRGGAKGRRGF